MGPNPHFILHWYYGFDGLAPKCQLVSSISLPAILAGCWDIMSLHFQIRSAKQISFSQEAPPVQRPELQEQATELISRGWGLSPSQAAFWEEGKPGYPGGVWAEVHSGSHHKSHRSTALLAPIKWWLELQEPLQGWPQVPLTSYSVFFRVFCFLKGRKVEQERERKKSNCS